MTGLTLTLFCRKCKDENDSNKPCSFLLKIWFSRTGGCIKNGHRSNDFNFVTEEGGVARPAERLDTTVHTFSAGGEL